MGGGGPDVGTLVWAEAEPIEDMVAEEEPGNNESERVGRDDPDDNEKEPVPAGGLFGRSHQVILAAAVGLHEATTGTV